MTIKEHQIPTLKNFINEGISCQNAASEGKKQYLHRVQEWLIGVCKENNEHEPFWIWKMTIPKVIVGTEMSVEDSDKFYTEAITLCLQQLNDILNNYFRQKELEESRAQTMAAIKSLKYTQRSLRISIYGLIASIIIPIVISIFTINRCTNTVKVEEKQYQQLKSFLNNDSIKGEQ